jgi:brassinosteroid-6-oxidase 2
MESHPHFMLFGGGGRMCPGKEVGIAEIATFLHYFVTQYRYVAVNNPHPIANISSTIY